MILRKIPSLIKIVPQWKRISLYSTLAKYADSHTSLLSEVHQLQQKYSQHLVLIRVGDFYEFYGQQAIVASTILNIALGSKAYQVSTSKESSVLSQNNSKKDCDSDQYIVEFTGFPARSLNSYIPKIIRHGFSIAICDQYQKKDASLKSNKFHRQLSKIITPATFIEDPENLHPDMTSGEAGSGVLMAFSQSQDIKNVGVAWWDISTSQFSMSLISMDEVSSHISRLQPREIILQDIVFDQTHSLLDLIEKCSAYSSISDLRIIKDSRFFPSVLSEPEEQAAEALKQYVRHLKGEDMPDLLITPDSITFDSTMKLDPQTLAGLEVFQTLRPYRSNIKQSPNVATMSADMFKKRTKSYGSLFWALNHCCTSSGSRLLKKWLAFPSLKIKELNQRLDCVEYFFNSLQLRADVRKLLRHCRDVEKIVQRLHFGYCSPVDIGMVLTTLEKYDQVYELICEKAEGKKLFGTMKLSKNMRDISLRFKNMFLDYSNLPKRLDESGLISKGIDGKLDKLYEKLEFLETKKIKMENTLRKEYSAPKLKLVVSNGIYVEVASSLGKMLKKSSDLILTQQLKGKHRYYFKDWEILANEIESCKESLLEREKKILAEIKVTILSESSLLLYNINIISKIDVASSLAEIAYTRNYVRPVLSKSKALEITDGRHAVIEALSLERDTFKNSDCFIPNGCSLKRNRTFVITGPNMGGKSTYLRQNALIILMSQIGSFVPAAKANIGIVDKIFSRIGAFDNIGQNQSTFMVEMAETANILQHATEKSFVIMDEIGRGTSLGEGMAIAYASLYTLHHNVKCRTLFATHYHELATILKSKWKNVEFLTTQLEVGDSEQQSFSFLYSLVPGISTTSHALLIAKLAGIPEKTLQMAKCFLKSQES